MSHSSHKYQLGRLPANEADWAAVWVEWNHNPAKQLPTGQLKRTRTLCSSHPETIIKEAAAASPPKMVAVIKNNLTEKEMDELGEQWANHQGPYMTVAETLAYATERAKKSAADAV